MELRATVTNGKACMLYWVWGQYGYLVASVPPYSTPVQRGSAKLVGAGVVCD